jgi:UvrD-like helicase family protein
MGDLGGDRALTKSTGRVTSWTTEQKQVIEAPVNQRLLIDAGPGTGKTATACARIAWLISQGGVEPGEIWLVSFTRTAVHELRSRIASYLPDPGQIAALRIATLDSHAWAIHSGFDAQALLSGFDNNIQRVIELVRGHDGVFEYLNGMRHLVIDEAQDVVGLRCQLLLELINALPESAGVSIFADEAQAIYGFAEEVESGDGEAPLPEKIRQYMGDDFAELDLSEVHRTQDPILLKVFRDGRRLMQGKRSRGAMRLQSARDLVCGTNHGNTGLYRQDIEQLPADADDTFLLFRRRGEVLDASGYLGLRPHRLRMSGLPICIHGWIAVLLWDWAKPEIEQSEFDQRWTQRIGSLSQTGAGFAWATLVKHFGRSTSRVSVVQMVARLASASPPYELTFTEFGFAGPLFGTIHGSKGREAGEVRLYLPPVRPPTVDEAESEAKMDEEARVLFVGATRAKKILQVGRAATKAKARRLEPSGRAYTAYPYKKGVATAKAAVEIGREGDIDAVGLVGRMLYASSQEAVAAQQRVILLKHNMYDARAVDTDATREWRYDVLLGDGGEHLCYLSPSVRSDLRRVALRVDDLIHLGKRSPPDRLNHLRIFGVRTMAVAESSARERLHAPWCDSGLIAAPMVIGYSMAYFRYGS